MGNSYATWQLGYPHCVSRNLLHRSIGSSAKNLCRLLKISCLSQLGPEKWLSVVFPFAVHVFFLNVGFLSCLSSFFSSPKKTDRKKTNWECISTVIISSHFSGYPLGANKKNPRPWNLAFTLWASFSPVSRCLALHCGTMKEMILESVVRWWNRQTPSTLRRVWACSRLRCHSVPRMFFVFVFRNGLEETTKNPTFLDPFRNPPGFLVAINTNDSSNQPRWRPALIGIHEPSYRVSKRRP